jgi:putative holliday junction resolvase
MPEGGAGPPRRLDAQIVLGFDFGRRRIGIACGDTLTRSAHALTTVGCTAAGADWPHIQRLISQWSPALNVVGLPYNADGSESDIALHVRQFANDLQSRFAIPVQFIDERYSSLDAHARLKDARAAGTRKRRVSKADIDASAACVILERWFLQATT